MAKKAVSSKKKAATKKAAKKTARKTGKKAAAKSKPAAKSGAKASSASQAPKKKTRKKKAARRKSPLTKRQLEQFRQILLEKRRALVGDMTGIESGSIGAKRGGSGSGDLSNMPTHPADIGSDNYEHEFSLGLLESERILLSEINEALQRINEGTFGICLGTGEPIGKARLTARPWAKYSIEYARMIEKGLVRPGDEENFDEDEEEDEDEDLDDRDSSDDDGDDEDEGLDE